MRVILLGGAPGIGKTTVTRHLLSLAQDGPVLVQCVDVDALWLHQPWRVEDAMKQMVQANLRAVMANALVAGIEILVIAWVFQSTEMQDLVRSLMPPGVQSTSVKLVARPVVWRQRFEADQSRPAIDSFYTARYEQAQQTPSDFEIDTDAIGEPDAARMLASIIGVGN